MLQIISSWTTTEKYKAPQQLPELPFLSIVIAARNEANNIVACIESIHKGTYPISKYEIIVINDHSEDQTVELLQALDIHNLKCLSQQEGKYGKKQALELGISQAKGTWIVTTDADCVLGSNWLKTIASYQQIHDNIFIASPVAFDSNDSLIAMFQSIDIMGTMAITLNGIQNQTYHMANGANMSFSKAAFYEVGGFEGNHQLASGDDMFLIQKMATAYPGRIHFLKSKEAIAYTKPEITWSGFIKQRIRWASKSSTYQENGIKKLLILVFLFCTSILVNILLIPFFGKCIMLVLTIQISVKLIMDFMMINKVKPFFAIKDEDLYGESVFKKLVLAAIHIPHIVASGVYGIMKIKTIWKGRKV